MALATSLTQSFNGNLTGLLGQLSTGLPGISVTRLAVDQILTAILADPAGFNLTTVTTACVTPNAAPFRCRHADKFLFWDGIHPTKAGHAILAEQTSRVLP